MPCVLVDLAASLEACPNVLQVEETPHCDETHPTVVSVDRFDEIVLGEIAMVVDCWPFASFVDCLGNCVAVEMVGFVDCCNSGFVCSGLLMVVW